jgi:hypothetical protein
VLILEAEGSGTEEDEMTHHIETRNLDGTVTTLSFATEDDTQDAWDALCDTPSTKKTFDWAVWKIDTTTAKGYRVRGTWGVEHPVASTATTHENLLEASARIAQAAKRSDDARYAAWVRNNLRK